MKFIEIENKLINLDNVTSICKSRVTTICKSNEELIRIHFTKERGYIDIEKESEEELNKVWERLKSLCMGVGEQNDKWHDLRKNPDDLPEADEYGCGEYVLVMIGTPEWNRWEQAYYHHGKRMWSTYEQNVFAWRYIEPFEENKDDE